jgi:hypothetical protein
LFNVAAIYNTAPPLSRKIRSAPHSENLLELF